MTSIALLAHDDAMHAPKIACAMASLIQFVLSNKLVDVALVGMRTQDMVESYVEMWRNENGRIDIDQLWSRYERPKNISVRSPGSWS